MEAREPLNIVVLLNSPEETRREYREGIPAGVENVSVSVINEVSEIDPHLASMDVLMTYGAFLRDRAEHVFRNAPRLRWIQALGSGVDNLLPDRGDIAVTCVRGIHDGAVSEAVFAAMLSLSRGIPRIVRDQRGHIWERRPARLLQGKTIGLLGVGLIALALAPRCKAFGMKVVGITARNEPLDAFDELRTRENLAQKVQDLDFLVVLTPYTQQTRNLVDGAVLAGMKATSYLVNVARGGIVDEAALKDILDRGAIAGAALDVFAEEPLPANHPFWDMDNVMVTPHIAGMNVDYVQRALPTILQNIRAFQAGDIDAMTGLARRPETLSSMARATAS